MFGTLEEVGDDAIAVVLGDCFADRPVEAIFASEFDAVADVFTEDAAAFLGGEFVMGVGDVAVLVFGEVIWRVEFADVVEVGADLGECWVGADGLGGVGG